MSVGAPDADQVIGGEYHDRRDHRWHKTDLAAKPAGSVAASRAVLSGDAVALMGWSVREPTGAAGASFRLRDGDANGEVLCNANLAANESIRDLFTHPGVRVETGKVFLDMIAGSVEGVIYWR